MTTQIGHRLRIPALGPVLLLCLGCSDLLIWSTQESVTWDFIQSRSSGIALGKIETADTELKIPMKISLVQDSAICIYDPIASVSKNRIEISVRKGLCGNHANSPLVAVMQKPRSGEYQIVYSDPQANYPILGTLHVD